MLQIMHLSMVLLKFIFRIDSIVWSTVEKEDEQHVSGVTGVQYYKRHEHVLWQLI